MEISRSEVRGSATFRHVIDAIDPAKGDLPALIADHNGHKTVLTYAGFQQQVRALGEVLLRMKLHAGENVALMAENRIEWVLTYFAVVSAGAVIVPVDAYIDADELTAVLNHARIKRIFCSSRTLKKLVRIRSALETVRQFVCFDTHDFIFKDLARHLTNNCEHVTAANFAPLAAKLAKQENDRPRPFQEFEYIHFDTLVNVGRTLRASGSDYCSRVATQPHDTAALIHMHGDRFVMLSHAALLANARAGNRFTPENIEGHRHLILLPLHHTFAMMVGCIGPLLIYGTAVIPIRFQTRTVLALAETYAIGSFAVVPYLLEALCKYIDNHKYDLSALKFIFCGGARMDVTHARQITAAGIPVLQGYGLTECSPIVSTNLTCDNALGTVGKPFPGTRVKIEAPDVDGNGEILIKGPNLMTGYYNQPAQTRAVIDRNGWLHSGDIGKFDSEGNLILTGRVKRIIVTRGAKNIYAVQLEDKLRQSRHIRDAVVVPRLDKNNGEIPFAYILLQGDLSQSGGKDALPEILQKEIADLFAGTPRYKIPAAFEVVRDRRALKKVSTGPFLFRDLTAHCVDDAGRQACPAASADRSGRDNVLQFLTAEIVRLLDVDVSALNPRDSLFELLDSIELKLMAEIIENELDLSLDPTLLFEYTTIEDLAGYIAARLEPERTRQLGDGCRSCSVAGDREQDHAHEDENAVAIVGISAVLPGSPDPAAFWQHLMAGDCLITEIPPDRFDWRDYYDPANTPEADARITTKWGGFIADIDAFDPLFFKITPKEAALMDPQQRLVLQCAWHALEDAGCPPSSLSGKAVGVFVGVSTNDYQDVCHLAGAAIEPYSSTGLAHSVLANRVSYFLNVHGPSEPVDTACSSSLVALHRGVNAMRNQECEMALVGGVNALLAVKPFIAFSKAGLMSPAGKCKTFSRDADGYVRGEGAGMLVLKKLGRAVADKNRIYAVIKGSAVNHGGRAGALTAPNPNAQAELLVAAYTRAGIAPDTVGYIEAHGTGTELGDPVEVNGLKNAFETLYRCTGTKADKRNYCGLGSVKTNIGHLEAAAGMAGLLKVLLAFKHQTLPPTINLTARNPYIDIDDSPFYIVDQPRTWTAFTDADDRPLPRRAGVSSFGFGGAYAHVVLEEYRAPVVPASTARADRYLFVLSARSKSRLKAYAAEVAAFVGQNTTGGSSPASLQDLAYTAQVGREQMPVRLALIVSNRRTLADRLAQFAQGARDLPDVFFNAIRPADAAPAHRRVPPGTGADLTRAGVTLLRRLARDWVAGHPVDWRQLNAGSDAVLTALPVYPFEKRRCWVDTRPPAAGAQPAVKVASPLLTADGPAQFSATHVTVLDRKHVFLRDHIIKGAAVLPGAVQVELARAAGQNLLQTDIVVLEDILFAHPVVDAGSGVDLKIRITKDKTQYAFEISNTAAKGAKTVFASGRLITGPAPDVTAQGDDLAAVFSRLPQDKDPRQFYRQAEAAGMRWGPALQSVCGFKYSSTEGVAELRLPVEPNSADKGYVLHPAILDGALQTVALWCHTDAAAFRPGFLAYLGAVTIYRPLTSHCFACVKPVDTKNTKFAIQISDARGHLLATVQDVFVKALPAIKPAVQAEAVAAMTYIARWTAAPLPPRELKADTIVLFDTDATLAELFTAAKKRTILVLPGTQYSQITDTRFTINPEHPPDYSRLLTQLKDTGVKMRAIAHLWPLNAESSPKSDLSHVSSGLTTGVRCLFHLTKALMQLKPQYAVRLVSSVHENSTVVQPWHTAATGFIKSLRQENPRYQYKLVRLDHRRTSAQARMRIVLDELASGDGVDIRYNGERQQPCLFPAQTPALSNVLKTGGVYLITGGGGALGRIFTQYLADTYAATVIALGRRHTGAIDASRTGQVVYHAADVSDRAALQAVWRTIRQQHGPLNGIIHAAGVIADNFILKKDIHEFNAVLRPKIEGTVNLDEVTRREKLDFLALFSSIVSVFGNTGQSDYATGNGFVDDFAVWRNRQVAQGRRTGMTLALNWPLWQDGGMTLDDTLKAYLRETYGMTPLQTPEGLAAFEDALSAARANTIVFKGDLSKQDLVAFSSGPQVAEPAPTSSAGPVTSATRAVRYFTGRFATAMDWDAAEVNPDEELERLSDTARLSGQLTPLLESDFGKLPQTLFYEYLTIREVAGYFLEHHGDKLQQLLDGWQRTANAGARQAGEDVPAQDQGAQTARAPSARADITGAGQATDAGLHAQTSDYFINLLATEFDIPRASIDVNEDLENYGLDSLVIMKINTMLEKQFGKLPRMLFFEYLNIHDLVGYFIENHKTRLLALFAESSAENGEPADNGPLIRTRMKGTKVK